MTTVRSAWYEIWDTSCSCKLAEPKLRYDTVIEAKNTIEKSKDPGQWRVMLIDLVTTVDEDGVVSTTQTTARV